MIEENLMSLMNGTFQFSFDLILFDLVYFDFCCMLSFLAELQFGSKNWWLFLQKKNKRTQHN